MNNVVKLETKLQQDRKRVQEELQYIADGDYDEILIIAVDSENGKKCHTWANMPLGKRIFWMEEAKHNMLQDSYEQERE